MECFIDLYFHLNMLLLAFVLNTLLIELMSHIDCVWFIWTVELSAIFMKIFHLDSCCQSESLFLCSVFQHSAP